MNSWLDKMDTEKLLVHFQIEKWGVDSDPKLHGNFKDQKLLIIIIKARNPLGVKS